MNEILRKKIEAEADRFKELCGYDPSDYVYSGFSVNNAYSEGLEKGAELAQEWISVSKDRLPSGDDTILVYLTDRKGSSAIRHVYYKNGIWRDIQTDGDVEFYEGLLATHWMNLPTPPHETEAK